MYLILSYILISGLILWFMIHSLNWLEDLKKHADKEQKQKIEDLEDWLYDNLGNNFHELLPVLEVISLLFGWLILPAALFESIFVK